MKELIQSKTKLLSRWECIIHGFILPMLIVGPLSCLSIIPLLQPKGEAAIGYGILVLIVFPICGILDVGLAILWVKKLYKNYRFLTISKVLGFSLIVHLALFGLPLFLILFLYLNFF
jgi:hypothetical protein